MIIFGKELELKCEATYQCEREVTHIVTRRGGVEPDGLINVFMCGSCVDRNERVILKLQRITEVFS